MAMQFKRQITAEESVNLTPLIDVVFLLLIFFMVSTTFTKESHLKIDLPEAVASPAAVNKEQVEVSIDAAGTFSVNGRQLVNAQKTTLEAALNTFAANAEQTPFLITADKTTDYQAVVTVMDVAGQLGFVNVSLTTRQPETPSAK